MFALLSENAKRIRVSIIYIVGVIVCNMGFEYLPTFDTIYGPLPMMAFFVGFIFVIRDYAQRHLGHYVLPLMIFATILVWLLVNPVLAYASAAAFLASEIIDWVVYTITKRQFYDRVLFSSIFSVPTDSFIFLGMMGFLSLGSFTIMSLSKFVATILIVVYGKYVKNKIVNIKIMQ